MHHITLHALSYTAFYDRSELKAKEGEAKKPGTLIIALTSDRGLCGAVHSGIAKRVKLTLSTQADAGNIALVLIGDKAKAMLNRIYPKQVLLMFNDFGKKPPTFADAVIVANGIINSGLEFEQGVLLYNRFK